MNKILFILKKRKGYGDNNTTFSSGLYNSAKFVNDMLVRNDVDSNIVEVIDNNDIDREVSRYKPTHVIIEALWVVPEKFHILKKLHPNVIWIVRIHSEIPFLSNEGIAMKWLYEYQRDGIVIIAFNSKETYEDFSSIGFNTAIYLPNYYLVDFDNLKHYKYRLLYCISDEEGVYDNINYYDIGCFGSIRPLKNQLLQAVAAIEFGYRIGKRIRFNINASRVEGKGDEVLKNIRELFKYHPQHILNEHQWYNHETFLRIMQCMDLNLQVSLNETFNIVTADAVNLNVPVIVSNEIPWVSRLFRVKSNTSVEELVTKMNSVYTVYSKLNLQILNKINLYWYGRKSTKVWLKRFKY